MNELFQLHRVAYDLLEDAVFFLGKVDLPTYRLEQELLLGSSIGGHSRHFIEFFQCLLSQWDTPSREIDYSKRKRDKQIENDPLYASEQVRTIQRELASLNQNPSCKLNCGEHTPGRAGHWINTSLERELLYNMDHTIHHLAIIKIGLLAVNPDFPLPKHFGYMPSTLQYQS
jgi:hypothetical protein